MALVRAQAASSSRCDYQVFLSFRGTDTRKTFTDHLYTALVNAGFRTFRDDFGLKKGEDIKLELKKAIQHSLCYIIVFSEHYASSGWCLDELVMILEGRRVSDHFVLPVFYHVDPSHVRKQTGALAQAFALHQQNQSFDKVKGWRAALTEVADLSGMVLDNEADGHESMFIQKVVNVIGDKLGRVPFGPAQIMALKTMASGEVKNLTDRSLEKLQMKLLSAKSCLDDAEEKLLTKPTVKEWVDELKEAIYNAEDLLGEIKTEALRRELEGEYASNITDNVQELSFSPFHAFDTTLMYSRINEVHGRLNLIIQQIDVLGLKTDAVNGAAYQTVLSTSFVEDSVHGRDAEKEAVIKLLLSGWPNEKIIDNGCEKFQRTKALLLHDDETSNKIRVIPIVGMGGIGKTTFAQLIYNDPRVRQHYDHFAWICVSENFDVLRITQMIDEQISSATCDVRNLDQLQSKVKTTVTGKKFLFVMDDVWNDNHHLWDSLRRSFECGAQGSTIVFTTRSEGVASMMGTFQAFHLKQMSDEDAWLLFEKYAFNRKGSPTPSNLEEIGRQVVGKCQGLPLAIKALGGLLRSYRTVEEWETILICDIWEVEGNVMPALLLSYCYLPPYLKRCFAYCSIFPRGYEFEKTELISLWKAEDLIQSTNRKTVEEVGEDYFNDLVSKSFFSPYQFRATDNKTYYIIHDLINNIAKIVSGEFCVSWEEGGSSTVVAKTRHFSFMKKYDHSNEEFEGLHEAKSLRTFLPLSQKMQIESHRYGMRNEVLNDLLPKLRCLRVLNLSKYDIRWLPDAIYNLIHLRHLNMSSSSILRLPDSICTLYNLQELFLSDCKALTELPTNLGRLINLTHLDIEGTNLRKMPAQMGNLKNLRVLNKFVLHKDTAEHDILELKKLHNLSGRLVISGIGNIFHSRALNASILMDKQFLKEVVLDWGGERSLDWRLYTQLEREVLDKLQPHPNLEDLSIRYYRGTMFPDWPVYYSSSTLVFLRLYKCGSCITLPQLGQLPSLRELHIMGLDGVRSIGPEFYGDGKIKPFRSLQVLSVNGMLGLEEWCNIGDTNHELEVFSNLQELCLIDLPNLTGTFAFDNFPMLKILFWSNLSLAVSRSRNKFLALTSVTFLRCPEIVSFPDGGLHAPNLSELNMQRCGHLRSMPAQMHNLLPSLQKLQVLYCPELESFPEGGLPSKLESLEISCENLIAKHMHWGLHRLTRLTHLLLVCQENEELVESFPEEGVYLPISLTFLRIKNFLKLKTINQKGIGHPSSLQTLEIMNCPALQCLPKGFGHLNSLQTLKIMNCPALQCFPEGFGYLSSLRTLNISHCHALQCLPKGFKHLNSLRTLEITNCPALQCLPEGFGHLISLQTLKLTHCPALQCLPLGLGYLNSLQTLEITSCGALLCFPDGFWHLNSLQTLKIIDCLALRCLPYRIGRLNSLQTLEIINCPAFQCFPGEKLPSSLTYLKIEECPLLHERCKRTSGQDWLKIAHIPTIIINKERFMM
ncbi:putative disease resistance RPP13-like protein 1 [Argentina anserina]|uniref:putative disease resistance RPP13-like protein 1 n=1 Tax=Argentina anserina TaxID=57926 RepID=UPI0021768007|nr:putative disease resistance RPP13-like protein 1 [Potentilla anserina]XP_050379381.1 putative disease resistance RPP13-like protein 1 [Potentilla anserina]XP_050379383.1 putative disease resistance RPP13-like protein 1 [Potentilla anserina]XP_050379384.1 putative disease resistance RPP13-like protein 1 [Potentilla anserina]